MSERALDSIHLVVPDFAEADWAAALADASSEEAPLIKAHQRIASLLARLSNTLATPERLAWLTLWSRFFSCVDAARGAISRLSVPGLHMVSRALNESFFHLEAIIEPVTSVSEGKKAGDAEWAIVLDRLRAYCAWSLAHDRAFYSRIGSAEYLDEVWEGRSQGIIARDPAHREFYEAFIGSLELMNQHELEAGRAEQERNANERVRCMTAWLQDERIRDWEARIKSSSGKKGDLPSFFTLVAGSQRNVHGHLKHRGRAFAYSVYARQSALMHGSTLEGSMRVSVAASGSAVVAPFLVGDSNEVTNAAAEIVAVVSHATIALFLCRSRIWAERE